MSELCTLSELLRPREWNRFVGNPLAVARVLEWCSKPPLSRGLLLISGPTGVGKTSLARLALAEVGCTSFVVTHEMRDLRELARDSSLSRPLDGSRPAGLLADDVDGDGPSPADVSMVVRHVPRCPVVATCSDAGATDGLRRLSSAAGTHVVLALLGQRDIQIVLQRACTSLKIPVKHSQALHLHECARGDARAAICAAEMDCRGNSDTVTSSSDVWPHTQGARDALLINAAIRGAQPGVDPARLVADDPLRASGMVFDEGLAALDIEDWSRACDDIAIADVMERRGGANEAHEMVWMAVASRAKLLPRTKHRVPLRLRRKVPSVYTEGKPVNTFRLWSLNDCWSRDNLRTLKYRPKEADSNGGPPVIKRSKAAKSAKKPRTS